MFSLIDSLRILLPELIPIIIDYCGSWYQGERTSESKFTLPESKWNHDPTYKWFFRDSFICCACEELPMSCSNNQLVLWKQPHYKYTDSNLSFQTWIKQSPFFSIDYEGPLVSFAISPDHTKVFIQSGRNDGRLAFLPSCSEFNNKRQRTEMEPKRLMTFPSNSMVWLPNGLLVNGGEWREVYTDHFTVSKWSDTDNDWDEHYLKLSFPLLRLFPLPTSGNTLISVTMNRFDNKINISVLDTNTNDYYQLGVPSESDAIPVVRPLCTFSCQSTTSSYSYPVHIIPNRHPDHLHEFLFTHDLRVSWLRYLPETQQLIKLGAWCLPHLSLDIYSQMITACCILRDGCSCVVVYSKKIGYEGRHDQSVCRLFGFDEKKQFVCQNVWSIDDACIQSVEEVGNELVLWDEKLQRHLFFI